MSHYPKVNIKNSVATRLLTVVFSLYFIVAMAVTLIHMGAEYFNTQKGVINDLHVFQKTFEHALATEVWNVDDEALASVVLGIREVPIIVGMKIEDMKGELITADGLILDKQGVISHVVSEAKNTENSEEVIFSELLVHDFPLYFIRNDGQKIQVGTGALYSSNGIVFEKVQYGFIFIVINSIIKTAALWLIFLLVARVILSRPLGLLTIATAHLSLDNLENFKSDINTYGRNEIKILEEGFKQMVQNLLSARQKLSNYALKIEEKNEALSQAKHRLELLLESSRKLSLTRNKFTALLETTRSILSEVTVPPGAGASIVFLDHSSSGKTGYAHFQIPTKVDNESRLKFIQLPDISVSYSLDLPNFFFSEERKNTSGSFLKNQSLYVAAWSEDTLLGFIQIQSVEKISEPQREFVDTLAQTLAIELKNIDFNFALLLAKEKLEEANANLEEKVQQRTRELQEAFRELEQQNTTLAASNRKLEDLNSTKEQLLHKIGTLQTHQMKELTSNLEALESTAPAEIKEALHQSVRQTYAIEEILHPITSLYFTEQAIQSKKVLLAETKKKQQILAKMALKGTGVELDIASDLEEGKTFLSQNAYDILYVNSELIELADWAYKQYPQIISVFTTSRSVPEYLPTLLEYPFLSNIVSRSDEDRTFTLKNILSTISKLISQDLFGLEKYLSWGVDVQQHQVTGSVCRDDLVEAMEQHLKELGIRTPMRSKASMIAEELLMNAVYDAPIDANGKALYNHLPRTVPVELTAAEYATFRYACDGLLLALSVEDPFGAFDRQTILEYLRSCYAGRAGSLNEKKGGAGRGLFQIIETADLVVFNVKPRIRTEVVAIFNIDPSKSKSEKTTSFHYFYG